MMGQRRIGLRYGRGHLKCMVSDRATFLDIREPAHTLDKVSFLAGLRDLLPPTLPNGPIAIVVADKTRLCGYPTILPWLVDGLRERGAAHAQIVFFIAYGTHAPQSEAESVAAYGPICTQYPFVHHHSCAPVRFAELGRTRRGTPLRIREDLLDAGLILTVGAVSHHYFAGFGGGRKLLFPGLGEQEAIYTNHRLFLDDRQPRLAPGCRPGQLAGNPIAEDLAEIHAMLPPHLSLHGLLDSQGRLAAVRFGATYADFLAACREHDALYRAATGALYDLVLASAGGYPKDINMIQTHKAIDNAAAFVRDGGTLMLLAECADGIGSTTFLPYFAMGGREAVFTHLRSDYRGNGGTALAMMAKTERIRIVLVTALPEELCRRIGVDRVAAEDLACFRGTVARNTAVIANASMLIPSADKCHDVPPVAPL